MFRPPGLAAARLEQFSDGTAADLMTDCRLKNQVALGNSLKENTTPCVIIPVPLSTAPVREQEIMKQHTRLVTVSLLCCLAGPVSAGPEQAPGQLQSVRPLILDQRRSPGPARWQNRKIRLTVGQNLTVLLPPEKFRPNRWLISREVLSKAGYQHMLPVITREQLTVAGRVTFRAISPGREVVSVFHLEHGGVPRRTPFSVLLFEVSDVAADIRQQLTTAQLNDHPDLLKAAQLQATNPAFRQRLGDLYERQLHARNVTPERQVAVLAALRTLAPEVNRWFQTSPREPLYLQRRAAGLTDNADLRKYFQSQLKTLSPARQASAFNSTLLAFALLGGESAVPELIPYSSPASGARANFVDEALRLATWNRFLKDAAPKRTFHENHGGPDSLFEAWKTWWTTRGSGIEWKPSVTIPGNQSGTD